MKIFRGVVEMDGNHVTSSLQINKHCDKNQINKRIQSMLCTRYIQETERIQYESWLYVYVG